ncbi:MAG: hypothetical protein KAY32_12725 [Candidatus Eisenbacteria sp.]|nr:hypothetical protein [Candidatus Eisenbacteria bacterium]
MIWSREQLASLKEKPLQEAVLVPLFEAMGYQDVHLRHGGILEQGKDIVMWQDEGLKGRVNYAVVVKAVRITGSVASAGQVLTQVKQSFAAPYVDRATHEERRIHYCLVVTSREIVSEGTYSLKQLLAEDNLDRYVRMLDGDELWKLLRRYVPQQVALGLIREGYDALGADGVHGNVQVHLTKDGIDLTVSPIGEEGKPRAFAIEPSFPDTEEGRSQKRVFEELMRTGGPITVDSSLARSLGFPDALKSLLPMDSDEAFHMSLGPPPGTPPLLLRIVLRADDGEEYVFPYVEFSKIVGGAEEIKASNEEQSVPCRVDLSLSKRTGHVNVDYSFALAGQNVYWLSEAIACQRVVAKGCSISMRDLRTGRSFPVGSRSTCQAESWPPAFCDLAAVALRIQEVTGALLTVPDRDFFTPEDVELLTIADHVIRTGAVPKSPDAITIERTPGPESASAFLTTIPVSGTPLRIRQPEASFAIWGTDVPLGPVEITCDMARIHPEDRGALEKAADDEVLKIRVVPAKGTHLVVRYPKWKAAEEQ